MKHTSSPSSSTAPANIVGNFEAKYETHNPIARRLVTSFLDCVCAAIHRVGAARIYEVGCGEGALAERILQRTGKPLTSYVATDVELEVARNYLATRAPVDPRLSLDTTSAYALPLADRSQPLVVCCEVLEHLDDPARALAEIARVTRGYVVVSTPREPIWRAMNLARGKYVRELGNTPGHVQHFSRRSLIAEVSRHFDIEWVQSPLPWTIILDRARS